MYDYTKYPKQVAREIYMDMHVLRCRHSIVSIASDKEENTTQLSQLDAMKQVIQWMRHATDEGIYRDKSTASLAFWRYILNSSSA